MWDVVVEFSSIPSMEVMRLSVHMLYKRDEISLCYFKIWNLLYSVLYMVCALGVLFV